jgi:hypothetical protein
MNCNHLTERASASGNKFIGFSGSPPILRFETHMVTFQFTYQIKVSNPRFGSVDRLPFSPQTTTLEKIGERWRFMDEDRFIIDVGSTEGNANRILEAIKIHNFTNICSVTAPNFSASYFS